jgi:hypothetical protein
MEKHIKLFSFCFPKNNHFGAMNEIINYNSQIGWLRVKSMHDNFYLYLLFNTLMNNKRYKTFDFMKKNKKHVVLTGCHSICFLNLNNTNSYNIKNDFIQIRKCFLEKYDKHPIRDYIQNDGKFILYYL